MLMHRCMYSSFHCIDLTASVQGMEMNGRKFSGTVYFIVHHSMDSVSLLLTCLECCDVKYKVRVCQTSPIGTICHTLLSSYIAKLCLSSANVAIWEGNFSAHQRWQNSGC